MKNEEYEKLQKLNLNLKEKNDEEILKKTLKHYIKNGYDYQRYQGVIKREENYKKIEKEIEKEIEKQVKGIIKDLVKDKRFEVNGLDVLRYYIYINELGFNLYFFENIIEKYKI